MPRKRRSLRTAPALDPTEREALGRDLRSALAARPGVQLSEESTDRLIDAVARAVGYARAGVALRQRGVSDRAATEGVLAKDVGEAMEREGLATTRWGWADRGGESLWSSLARIAARHARLGPPAVMRRVTANAGVWRTTTRWKRG
jgi:hypothetical protein